MIRRCITVVAFVSVLFSAEAFAVSWDELSDSQRELLFGREANDIGSVALVPLGDHGSLGLLALGSTDRDRFHPGMSTEFLARMAELITDALSAR